MPGFRCCQALREDTLFKRNKSDDLTGPERLGQLAEDQLDEARNLTSLANWLSRTSGLFFVLSVVAGIMLIAQTQRGTCSDGGFGSTCSGSHATHPFVTVGFVTIGVGLFWSLIMALIGSWARAYALCREIESERLLASRQTGQ